MPAGPTLSAIIPNYTHGRLLGRALTALFEQERPPDEIIIIDDGSTDGSLAIINALASTSSLVRVLANETNRGVTFTLSRGLEACGGTYVYLAAADDWVLPGFFGSALRLLERYPQAGLVCGEANLVSGRTGKSLGVRPAIRPTHRVAYLRPAAVAAMLKHSDNWILTGSTIFVRERLRAAGGLLPELGSFADGYVARKLALTHGFIYIPRPVATWQVFEDSFSRETASDPARAQQVLASAIAHFERDPCFPRWYGKAFRQRWQFAAARLAAMAHPVNESVLLQVVAPNRIDHLVLSRLCRMGAALRPLLLAWLWFRFTPMNLGSLWTTALLRRVGIGSRWQDP